MDLLQLSARRGGVVFRTSVISRLAFAILADRCRDHLQTSPFGQLVQPPQFGGLVTTRGPTTKTPSPAFICRPIAPSRGRSAAPASVWPNANTTRHWPFCKAYSDAMRTRSSKRSGDDRGQLGLKATARQMIGELPPEGRDAYELLQGATARRQLEAAFEERRPRRNRQCCASILSHASRIRSDTRAWPKWRPTKDIAWQPLSSIRN